MIETKKLVRSFRDGDNEFRVLKEIDFRAEDGEFISIMGRSGAGKSTFLYQISLLDHPTSGDILIDGKDANKMESMERVRFRLKYFGYVFQDYALLPELTAIENVALPLLMQGKMKAEGYKEAAAALARVGLGERLDHLPSQLSGGEQQRVSIARAMAHKPKVLFADEPSANLDRESSDRIMNIFEELHQEGQTIIMVTHEEEYAMLAEKLIKFDEGRIVSIIKPSRRESRKLPNTP